MRIRTIFFLFAFFALTVPTTSISANNGTENNNLPNTKPEKCTEKLCTSPSQQISESCVYKRGSTLKTADYIVNPGWITPRQGSCVIL